MNSEELNTQPPPPTHPSMQVQQAIQDLLWLARNDSWMGAAQIVAERKSQVERGFDAAHDHELRNRGELAQMATVQAAVASYMAQEDTCPYDVTPPLAAEAGALCAAEIDRMALEQALEALPLVTDPDEIEALLHRSQP